MITTMLASRAYSEPVLDYNEGKVASFEAKVVHTMNLAESHPSALYETFGKMESNPRIPAQARSRSFHMAVNPGPDDTIDEEGVKQYVEDLMQYLGYGNQPVVVYRHEDIDRVHYHVVSTRFDENGRGIKSSMEGRRIKEFNETFGEKYGFRVGADKDSKELAGEEFKSFDVRKRNHMLQFDRLMTEALKYPVTSRSQFQFLMRAMNVRCTFRQRKDGGYNTILAGLDANGKQATRIYSMERTFGRQAFDELNGRIAEQKGRTGEMASDAEEEALVELKAKVDFCLIHCMSMRDFIAHIKGLGLNCAVQRDRDGIIQRVLISDPEHHFLLDTSAGGKWRMLSSAFRDAESTGRWAKPSPEKVSMVVRALKFPASLLEEMMRFIQRKIAEFRTRRSVSAGGMGRTQVGVVRRI